MNNDNSNMMKGTPTPGSMRAENPEAAHMMEPITAPNVQPATKTEGGQPLAYREDNGLKIFELTTKAVQWSILDGVTVGKYAINANFSMSGNWELTVYVHKDGLDYKEDIDFKVQ